VLPHYPDLKHDFSAWQKRPTLALLPGSAEETGGATGRIIVLLLESWECGNHLGDSQGVVDDLGLAIRNPGISTTLTSSVARGDRGTPSLEDSRPARGALRTGHNESRNTQVKI
jgi:hypothetical protein